MAGKARSTWLLWALAASVAVSVAGVAINIATDLKTSILAWGAVSVATMTGGVVAWVRQLTTSEQRVHQMIVVACVAGCVVAIILEILALALTSESGGTTGVTKQGNQTSTPARAIQNTSSYRLVSSSDFCPTGDKVDLDTGSPGYGGQTQIGDYIDKCRVEGGLAELILEQNELHTPKNSQLLHLLESNETVGYEECRTALRDAERLRSKISLEQLHIGDHICAKTDQGNIAQITITDMRSTTEAKVIIDFTTWR